jgi:hypothetical protein
VQLRRGLRRRACEVSRTVTLSWAAPTHYTNGEPIRTAVTYNLYQIADDYVPEASGIVGTSYRAEVRGEAGHCFYVRALVGGHLSAGSNIACVEV